MLGGKCVACANFRSQIMSLTEATLTVVCITMFAFLIAIGASAGQATDTAEFHCPEVEAVL